MAKPTLLLCWISRDPHWTKPFIFNVNCTVPFCSVCTMTKTMTYQSM